MLLWILLVVLAAILVGTPFASSYTTYLSNKVLDHFLKTATFTAPTNLYVALFTTLPNDSGGGTEVSGGSYARVNHNAWNAASSGSATNNGAITFTTASGSWGTVGWVALFDASSGGNMLCWGAVGTAKTISSGDTASFADTALAVTLD